MRQVSQAMASDFEYTDPKPLPVFAEYRLRTTDTIGTSQSSVDTENIFTQNTVRRNNIVLNRVCQFYFFNHLFLINY